MSRISWILYINTLGNVKLLNFVKLVNTYCEFCKHKKINTLKKNPTISWNLWIVEIMNVMIVVTLANCQTREFHKCAEFFEISYLSKARIWWLLWIVKIKNKTNLVGFVELVNCRNRESDEYWIFLWTDKIVNSMNA